MNRANLLLASCAMLLCSALVLLDGCSAAMSTARDADSTTSSGTEVASQHPHRPPAPVQPQHVTPQQNPQAAPNRDEVAKQFHDREQQLQDGRGFGQNLTLNPGTSVSPSQPTSYGEAFSKQGSGVFTSGIITNSVSSFQGNSSGGNPLTLNPTHGGAGVQSFSVARSGSVSIAPANGGVLDSVNSYSGTTTTIDGTGTLSVTGGAPLGRNGWTNVSALDANTIAHLTPEEQKRILSAAIEHNSLAQNVGSGQNGAVLNSAGTLDLRSNGIVITNEEQLRQVQELIARAADLSGQTRADSAHHILCDAEAGWLPARSDELWIIERHVVTVEAHQPADDIPGAGALIVHMPNQKDVPVPLKHTDVHASVTGYIATVDVTQQFQNPYDSKIEAVYVFPLPDNAAVNDFVMTIGDRHIRGIIREKEEAKQIYQEAKSQGYVASLLTQDRPNVFTQSVANIEPGKKIDIDIKYFNTLTYSDGWYEFAFPMVVGPRFNPPGFTGGIGAVPNGQPNTSGQATEVQYLKSGERSGHDISLDLKIDAGVAIEKIDSRNHHINIKQENPASADVTLAAEDTIPNKDFVLRYKVASGAVKSAVMTQRDENGGGYFTLMLFPPEAMASLPRKPIEMVFTIDVSGSQQGLPFAQEKAAVCYALQHLQPYDTFQVVRFGDTAQKLYAAPVPATEHYVREAVSYVQSLQDLGNEGTMLVDGVHASLDFPHDENRLRFVTFLTDGFIGNESEALGEIHKYLGPSRIFSFGVGSSTNRYLLDGMAKMGNGAATYLGLNDDASEVMQTFLDRISHPAMTDLSVDLGDMKADQVLPGRLPDLFVGRPVILTGKFTGHGKATIHVRGKAGNENQDIAIPVDLDAATPSRAVAAVWARQKIADLADHAAYEGNSDLPGAVKSIALEYGLMSAYTSFVAVDASARTTGDSGTTVAVPVPVPDGVKYETTVHE